MRPLKSPGIQSERDAEICARRQVAEEVGFEPGRTGYQPRKEEVAALEAELAGLRALVKPDHAS